MCLHVLEGHLVCFGILKELASIFLRLRIAKLGLCKERGGTRSSWTAKLGYSLIYKIVGFL